MKGRVPIPPFSMEKKWSLLLITSLIVIFLLTFLNMGHLSSSPTINTIISILPSKLSGDCSASHVFVESKCSVAPPPPSEDIPCITYLISRSKGNIDQLWRTLHALYHPRNIYVMHLNLKSSMDERRELTTWVSNHSLFSKVENVHMITKANMVTYRGPTMVANNLYAYDILLKKSKKMDWSINLSASNYPLVMQDGQRAKPLIINPRLYMKNKSDVLRLSSKGEVPNAFKLFTGIFQFACFWDTGKWTS